jgi:uncharacterized protein (TIGR03118 family)
LQDIDAGHPTKDVDVAGQGNGFVDVFATDGHLVRRFASRGTLNSPWGVAQASSAFGRFSGDILVGNLGDGRINVFNSAGDFRDQLSGVDGRPLTIVPARKLAAKKKRSVDVDAECETFVQNSSRRSMTSSFG